MKVLILSITAGEGHNSTARAIKKELNERAVECTVLDTYEYVSPALQKIVADGYLAASSHAKAAYEATYRAVENRREPISDKVNLTRLMNKPIAHKIDGFIAGYAPDVVVYTHAFAGIIIDLLKQQGELPIKAIGILTDFTFHPFWEECARTDYVVTANEMLTHQARAKGFTDAQIVPIGIPINEIFANSMPKERAREQLGLDINKRTVLLMGGSMGYGNMRQSVEKLDALDADFQLITVCGNNSKARARIGEMNLRRRILNLGFVSNVDVLMDAADCIVTKPGGLTSSEALAKCLPMIIVNPIPGQEFRNSEFLLNNGVAMATSDTVPLEEAMFQFFGNEARAESMRRAAQAIRKPNSARDICDLIVSCGKK